MAANHAGCYHCSEKGASCNAVGPQKGRANVWWQLILNCFWLDVNLVQRLRVGFIMIPILLPYSKPQFSSTLSFRVSLLVVGVCILVAASGLTSCSTVRGFGQDVERTGEAIENSSN